ncbi:hypothetical protein P170DRAFT_132606 [Aspergillus steynii IBT 23096]|uniref:Uncharacterized protein n=1 Tax=Aspergillus steynii IBT 23096 TaxID=1392250 RepID=A0A2I2FQE1_9EURO|nr:hypothetical protein P170DRAFT_132606 [Aspergillus steynii IBT 23096]
MPQPGSARKGDLPGFCARTGSWRATQCGQLDGRMCAAGTPGRRCDRAPCAPLPEFNTYKHTALSGLCGSTSAGNTPGRVLYVPRYLVDSASSHMLVSKIKPCMSKYKHFIL